jgi:FkbM family methyltransferase
MIKQAGKLFYRLKGHYPVRIGNRKFRGDPFHIGFWRIVNRGGFESDFFPILDEYLDDTSVLCDLGAWIGPVSMYASAICKKVYAFEPDPVAYPYLIRNLKLNSINNVIPDQRAVAPIDGRKKMASFGGNLGDSMTSMIHVTDEKESVLVETVRWDTWLKSVKPGKISAVKMDIEGGETEVIPDMLPWLKSEKPILFLSVHGAYLKDKALLERMFEGLKFYKQCFDHQKNRVILNERLIGDAASSFRSYVFIP